MAQNKSQQNNIFVNHNFTLYLYTVGFCNQTSSWSLSSGWTEEICSQQPSLVGDWSRVLGSTQLISHVLGAVYYKERLSL